MPSLKQIMDEIAYDAGRPHDHMLKQKIRVAAIANRGLLMRREYDKHGIISPAYAHAVKCIPTIQVDQTECCDIDTGCKIVRTVDKLPSLVETGDILGYLYVGSPDWKKAFGYILPHEIPFIKHRELSRKDTFYTSINNYIYIVNNPSIESITVRGQFSDPTELKDISDCTSLPCFDEDQSVFIPDHLYDPIKKMIYVELGIVSSKKPQQETVLNPDNDVQ